MIFTPITTICYDEIKSLHSPEVPPFGYSDTTGANTSLDLRLFKCLYVNCESFTKAEKSSYCIVLGRRGSGKSSLIQAIKLSNKYDCVVECPQEKIINNINKKVSQNEKDIITADHFVTECIDYYWFRILEELVTNNPKNKSLRKVRRFLQGNGVFEEINEAISDTNATSFLSLVKLISKFMARKRTVNFEQAQVEATEFINNNSYKMIILMDTLEEYKDLLKTRRGKKIVSAILLSTTRSFRDHKNIDIKCFFPTEYYITGKKYIANYQKIFTRVVVLRWNAEELWTLIIRRLIIFLFVKHGKSGDVINFNDFNKVQSCYKLWLEYFPDYVENDGDGDHENSFTYILRHTQMIPMHLISCCNKIEEVRQEKLDKINNHLGVDSTKENKKYSEKEIKTAVSRCEHNFAEAILSSFNYTHESIYEYKDYLSQIYFRTNLDKLEELYGKIRKENEINFSFDEFKKILFSMGIFGRMEYSEKQLYDYAIFEPNIENALGVNRNDILLVHPIFIKELKFLKEESARNKPICSGHAKFLDNM